MYLARHRVKGKINYTIRESYKNDTGGDHEKFIKLANAYKSLLAAKAAEIKTRSG